MFLVAFLLHVLPILALNLGFEPRLYVQNDKIDLLVNKVESDQTQLPYSYYLLPFVCPPATGKRAKSLSLGQIFRGDRVWESDYEIRFGVDMPCMRLCDFMARDSGIKKAASLIKQGYVVHWLVDGLPGATTFLSATNHNKYYAAGFPLGFFDEDIAYIYNHVMLVIRYHKNRQTGKSVIVGFEVYPKSVSNENCPGLSKDYKNFALIPPAKDDMVTIPYTYLVYWREDNSIDYDLRWALYYENDTQAGHRIHWLSFVNSLVLAALVSLAVAVILARVVKSDKSLVPALPTAVSDQGWKELAGAVVAQPRFHLPLTVLVASGIQLLVAAVGVVVVFVVNSKFDFSSSGAAPAFFHSHQGAFISLSIFCCVALGFVASYAGIVVYKIFRGHDTRNVYGTQQTVLLLILFSAFLPGFVLAAILFLNFFVWFKESSSSLPFGTVVVLLLIFGAIEIPLGIAGGIYGNKSKLAAFWLPQVAAVAEKPRPNFKKSPWLLRPVLSTVVFGLIPFGIVYVELLFILNSVWLEKTTFYYMYGFLLLTTIVLIVVIAESTLVATYVLLAVYRDPNWHWLCFRVGSSIGWYIYGYLVYYFSLYLRVRDFVSILLYFAYMGLASVLVGVAFGAVGVLTGMMFVRRLYGDVKLD